MTGPIASGDGSLPAWSAPFAADHRAGLERLAPLGRLDRDWAFGDGRRRRHHGRGRRLGRRGRPPGDRRARSGRASGSSSTARTRRSSTTMRSTSSATERRARRSSTPSRRTPTSCRSGCSGPTTGARAPRSRPASSGRSTRGAGIINLSLSSRSDAMFGVFHDLADRAYFAERAARLRREQHRGRQLPVAVRGGRLGRRPRRPRPRTSGSTTRSRRSSSGRTGSTSTSPGRAAAGSSRRATASPRRTSRATRRGSGRPTPAPARSRSRRSSRRRPTRPRSRRRTARRADGATTAGQRNAPSAGRRGVDMAKDVRRSYWV